jgi:1,2-dihydroxy-3,5-cyclohexadiene-1,4-dicarboxylate dehydrogenase
VRALCEPVLVGHRAVLQAHAKSCRLSVKGVRTLFLEKGPDPFFGIGEIRPEHGRATLDAARAAIEGALAGEYAAVVAAPHSETAIHAAGIEFDGYPSFVARTAGAAPEDGILMLCFAHARREVRIAHVTLHANVLTAVKSITRERVQRTIAAVDAALKKMGIEKPRIAVSGVNPHAVGAEEEKLIRPAIEAARDAGIVADGPIGADTLLQREFDAYVVMLHDQGHVAAKVLAPNGAAAMTIGTPVLFSSVAHGAAFDIAGQNKAEPRAMVEAITRLVTQRRRALTTRKSL